MTVTHQVGNPDSNLGRFLDQHLPNRHAVIEDWRWKLGRTTNRGGKFDCQPTLLGRAFEMRLGLGLAEQPGYRDLLAHLPPAEYANLLTVMGFRHQAPDDPLTTDPWLQHWRRPDEAHGPAGDRNEAFMALYDAATMELRVTEGDPVQVRRQTLAWFRDMWASGRDRGIIAAMARLEQLYEDRGYSALVGLGERVLLEPLLAPGFAVADLIIGKTLVDVKVHMYLPDQLLDCLDQLLAYLLVDRWNRLFVEEIAIYSGWHGLVLSASVDDLLTTASPGETPNIHDLREDFHQAMSQDLDDALCSHQEKVFGIPAHAWAAPDAE